MEAFGKHGSTAGLARVVLCQMHCKVGEAVRKARETFFSFLWKIHKK